MLFTGGQAWRASAFGSPSPGAVISGEGCLTTGDGGCEPIYLKVNAVSMVNDWFSATFVSADGSPGIRHTYASPNDAGAPWQVAWSSCCRISPQSSGNFHANNPDQSERLETRVDLASPNSAPKTALPPINPCPRDSLCTIDIPSVDADGDTLDFRLSTPSEAGDPGYVPPGAPYAPNQASVDAPGVLTWDTTGATVSPTAGDHTLYSVQVMIEDGKTQTPIDFFIEIVPADVHPPRWVTPPTPCGETFIIGAGAPFAFGIEAVSDDGRPVALGHFGIPTGAAIPIPPAATPVTSAFTWTPDASQVGSHLVVLAAEDDRGYAAPPCAVTIVVVDQPIADARAATCAAFGTVVTFDGSASIYPAGQIVEYRWDFSHGPSPLFGPVVARALVDPQDLAGLAATLTITTNDSKVDTDSVVVTAFDSLDVEVVSAKAKYTPFQRPHGTVDAGVGCGLSTTGSPVDVTITYTTHDAQLDALIDTLLGANARVFEMQATLGPGGTATWRLPFTVAERFGAPLGLLNPMSKLLLMQGEYLVEAHVDSRGVDGDATTTFDVVIDEQFPLDEPPA